MSKQNDIFIGMTFSEFEVYKQYLEVIKGNTPVSFVSDYHVGMGCYKYPVGILNESETIRVLRETLEKEREKTTEWINETFKLRELVKSVPDKSVPTKKKWFY